MNLIVYATPFFILAILVELAYGVWVKRNTYRLNDSVSSLFLGSLSQAQKLVTLGIGGYIYYMITEYFSLSLMDPGSWVTWVVAMVLYDLCYYWLHRIGHERTIFWAAHVAHHQSEDYNLTTALRQTSTGFLFGWIFFIPMFLVGIPAEVYVSVGAINLLYQFWVHTQHIGKLGWYEWFFVTPSNHRVHHAQNDMYMDRNYGGLFILWDRLFGTFQEELNEHPVIFGIRGPLKSWNPVKALTHIYVDMAQDSWRTQHWGDKLRVWVSRTGWRPADVAERYPREKNDLSTFERFDPRVPTLVSVYGFFQLLSVFIMQIFMQAGTVSYTVGVIYAGVLLATAIITALWLEGRSTMSLLKWEVLRLVALVAILLLWTASIDAVGNAAGWGYIAANVCFLWVLWRRDSTNASNATLS